MTPLDIVKSYAAGWRSLAAWHGALGAVTVKVMPIPRTHTRRLGTAWSCERRANVYVTGDLIVDLPTVLHELAHLAAPRWTGHERPWRELYLAAVAEATKSDPTLFDADVQLDDLRAQAMAAVEGWLDATGQLTVFKALGVMR